MLQILSVVGKVGAVPGFAWACAYGVRYFSQHLFEYLSVKENAKRDTDIARINKGSDETKD